jgi:ankyrin repeat protein
MQAVKGGFLDGLQFLASYLDADVDRVNHYGYTTLILVSWTGTLEMMRWLIEELGADVHKALQNGDTPLHIAACTNRCDIARFLVKECGVDVNLLGASGHTPLIRASWMGKTEMVRCLVSELGADVYITTPNRENTFYARSLRGGELYILRCLVMEHDNFFFFDDDVNEGTQGRYSALFAAAYSCQISVMRCLVEELGASIAEVNADGDTVLLYSARHAKLESIQYLLEHGGASLTETSNNAITIWDLLTVEMMVARIGPRFMMPPHEDPEAMTALLRVILLRGVPPPEFLAFVLPAYKSVVNKGARLRARLPAFLTRRRALVDATCLLILPLLALVHGYESELPFTTDEIWATGFGEFSIHFFGSWRKQ